MATSLTLENDSSLAQGYIKVNGSTAATLTTTGIIGNLTGNVTGTATDAAIGSQLALKSAKAWVNFNGTTSPGTIRSSYNVSSVTKNATGDYTVNFTTPMADANYSATATTQSAALSHFAVGLGKSVGTYRLVTGYVTSFTAGFSEIDVANISVQVFGN